jgi:non-homologous end joining protein Ku
VKVSEKEIELGVDLIDRLTSEEFHPKNYQDEYRIRVQRCSIKRAKAKKSPFQPLHGSAAATVSL